ncbi:MAG: sensor histidine kinase [Deltaproteobacteria bacterium]|nr:sensor histidine kinase [Myxococcales bacterium]MDP3212922.1 sensor histidine kinase [Deltaproteobacteria bacterium]
MPPPDSPLQRLLLALIPERGLDPEARALFEREGAEANLDRVRTWGLGTIALQTAALWVTVRLPVHTPLQVLWQRDLVRLSGVLIAACALLQLGAMTRCARSPAFQRALGPTYQLVAVLAYALIGVNAQRSHGSVGQYVAVVIAMPFIFRTPSAWFGAVVAVTSAIVVAGILAAQPSTALRSINAFAVLAFAVFGLAIARNHTATLVRELRHRLALARLNAELESRVADQTRELRRFAMRLDGVLEAERRRLARDLHDDLGQELTAMRFEVEALRALAARDHERAGLARLAASLDRSHLGVRAILESLRPRILDEEGLAEAVRWLARQFGERTGCECAVEVALPGEPDAQVGLVAFRIAQESLTNVARHAGASRVTVTLACDGDGLRLEIADDGPPRSAAHLEPGRGMTGMHERAVGVGGQVSVTARSPRGTLVRATLPFRPTPPSAA